MSVKYIDKYIDIDVCVYIAIKALYIYIYIYGLLKGTFFITLVFVVHKWLLSVYISKYIACMLFLRIESCCFDCRDIET